MKTRYIVNGRVYTGRSFQEKTVGIQDGTLRLLPPDAPVSGEVHDAAGKRVVPGFIDIHTHGAVGVDVNGAPPDGESQMDVLRRTAAAMEAIQKHMAAGGAQAAAVVSHGASIHCMLAWLLKEEAPSDCPIHNASITVVCWETKTGTCRLETLGDIRHLPKGAR